MSEPQFYSDDTANSGSHITVPETETLDREALEAVLNSLSQTIRDDEYIANIGAIEEFVSDNGDNPTVKVFNRETSNYSSSQKRAIVQHLAKVNGIPQEQEYLYTGNYLNHGFLKNHMRRLLSYYEGMFACVDKFATLTNLYKKQILDSEFNLPTEQQYCLPTISSIPLWLGMITALIRLHAGDNKMYLEKLVELEEFYKNFQENI